MLEFHNPSLGPTVRTELPPLDTVHNTDPDMITIESLDGARGIINQDPEKNSEETLENKEQFEFMDDHDVVNGGVIGDQKPGNLDTEEEQENSPIDVVRATVKITDNPALPTFTFRALVLGTLFCILGAAVSEFYYFRSNALQYSSFFVTLIAYPLGNFLSRVLTCRKWRIFRWEFTLNPGPFNIKEHCLIVIIASSGGVSAYGTDILAVQDLYYKQNLGPLGSILLLLSTQCLGYGIAGFFRTYLVYPATMIWPSTLPSVTLFNTFHETDAYLTGDHTMLTPEQEIYAARGPSRMRFFMIVFVATFLYELFPLFLMPVLSSLAVLCLIGGPNNFYTNNLGSAFKGSGILNIGLDWNVAGATGPLYTPWWAQVNLYIGAIIMIWIIGPLIYFNNFWNAQKYPIMTTLLYDNTSHVYNHSRILTSGFFNSTLYASYSPVIMTPHNAMMFAISFVSLTAAVTHVTLYYGRDLHRGFKWWNRGDDRKTVFKADVHTRMMRASYKEVPMWWYLVVFAITLVISIVVCEVYPIYLPWWALLVAVAMAIFLTLPIGVIQAISGTQPGLNVITEMVCGYMLPGRPIANVTFKCNDRFYVCWQAYYGPLLRILVRKLRIHGHVSMSQLDI
ncbi:hypothetical protein BC937DRAFT_95615 [Endogone sp. FLAS-F59071]|nr:hypothetical protein BC937DRAFT_95615 [Endogone sp. FLAS-F59071]|eukprot:RUS20241.1 hypothetical protein BC937DRAFT_95615 [Endogone sp. FLAS-F59071]